MFLLWVGASGKGFFPPTKTGLQVARIHQGQLLAEQLPRLGGRKTTPHPGVRRSGCLWLKQGPSWYPPFWIPGQSEPDTLQLSLAQLLQFWEEVWMEVGGVGVGELWPSPLPPVPPHSLAR